MKDYIFKITEQMLNISMEKIGHLKRGKTVL